LSSFVAAVYALQEAGHFRRSVGLPLRPIVAESLWIQGQIEKKAARLQVVLLRSPIRRLAQKMPMD